jgi:hypothetical protein
MDSMDTRRMTNPMPMSSTVIVRMSLRMRLTGMISQG